MLIEIQKTEMREIILDSPRYVKFTEMVYYAFTPNNDTIEVLLFRERDGNFELSSRIGIYESQIDILELTHEYAEEITEDEFKTKLQELLLKYI